MPVLPGENEMLAFVRDSLKPSAPDTETFYFRDRFCHTLRVMQWVKRLCASEECDARLAVIAAIFHDCGYRPGGKYTHAQLSADICQDYMRQHGFPEGDIAAVCEMVRLHSYKAMPVYELSPELRVLMDADILDELGVTICIWDSLYEGHRKQGGYYDVLPRLKRAYEKLERYLPTMRTATGRAEYDKGLNALKFAIERLEYELMPELIKAYT